MNFLPQQNGQGFNFNNIPSTSSNPSTSSLYQHMNGSANTPAGLTQSQGQSSFNPMNHAQWGVSQQPQQLNQWNNIPPQPQFLHGMNAVMSNLPMNMNPVAFPLFQQMLHDALALSAPIAGQEDERLLIDTLVEAQTQNENYKNALNRLHGRNDHLSSMWKDHYLEHRERIDEHVTLALKQKGVADIPAVLKVKKPRIDSFKPEPSPSVSPPPAAKRKGITRPLKDAASSSSIGSMTNFMPSKSRKRSTINSLTTHTPSFNSRLPPPNAQIKIPDPPSRSPTPPTKMVPFAKGYRFTEEDKEFFIKFILWRLKGDSSLTRNDLCDQLAQKAPHHSASSWYAFWSNNHDLPDKIIAAAHGEPEQDSDLTEDESADDEDAEHRRHESKYKEESISEDENREGWSADDDDDVSDHEFTLPSFDESKMGLGGGSYTEADLALLARYVASFDNFPAVSSTQKWKPWGERYSRRSAKSWAEYYRKHEREILALAKKIRKAGGARGLSPKREISKSQPGWNSNHDSGGPPKAKRKLNTDDQEQDDVGNRSKMSKFE